MSEYRVIGVMSGTSLDGLDIACCRFRNEEKEWIHEIEKAETIEYDAYWKNCLLNANELSAESFLLLHNHYGKYIGERINDFMERYHVTPDLISSHGHTVFHQPENRFTFQIGHGACIAAQTQITTISDFRILDIAHGGQGAPLVPVGDQLLFKDYDYYLNLGGFANISFINNNKQIAFDICPCNIVINFMSKKINLAMDKGGEIAKKGFLDKGLLKQLNKIEYYSENYPKSLGKEWLDREFIPILENSILSFSDVLRTIYEHISEQIAKVVKNKNGKILITGGGAFNDFLISLIMEKIDSDVVIPDKSLISFKEALIFAFLGLLRYQDKINCLSSVTGASRDCSGGVIYKI